MEWDWDMRRTQSLKSIPSSSDKLTWTDGGLRDKATSVSQLVARYQTAVKNSTLRRSAPVETGQGKTKNVLNEMTSSPLQTRESHLESLMRRNKEREQTRGKTNLSRSKSMGSLQTGSGSIEALRAVFESKSPAQKKVRRSFKTTNVTLSPTADVPMMNGEAEDVQRAAEEKKIPTGNKARKEANEDYVAQKVENQTQMEKRKTIAGIDFEKIAASEAYEKRRTISDFRDSSFIQTKEILSVSVKAMSALYMSKVATQDSTNSISKEQDQTCEFQKREKLSKMEEDSQQKTIDHLPPQPERHETVPEDISGEHPQQSQLSKQMLYQQRQKNELRRLLKHTQPELKTLDDVVDEEFAEVLSSETATADDMTGYEGEVLSRRLIFESRGSSGNMSPYTAKIHMAPGAKGKCDCSKILTVSESSKDEPLVQCVSEIIENDNSSDLRPDFTKDVEEEVIRVDIKATRSIFESQSRPNPDGIQGNVSNERKTVQKPNKVSEISCKENIHDNTKNTNSNLEVQCGHVGQRAELDFSGRDKFHRDEPLFEDDFTSSDSESHSEKIKTSASLFQNNPFISTNIEREHSYGHTSILPNENSAAGEDYLTANVKNRTHLFESMPFDKIMRQNRDEIEMMVEIIKETLNFLYQVKAIQSAGVIIEVNDTMFAKKAKFTLTERGPEIKYDEVAEGGAQNFILQLLPRVNLKPQITYLKEDSKGSMKATVVDVLVHHRQVNTKKDTEFKTANVVQLVEDILNQDNSLRKGVIIQEDVNNSAEVIVYSLYKYLDGEEVKSYNCPKSADYNETEADCMTNTDDKETRSYLTASIIRSPQETTEDQTCPASIRPNVRVNVKLLKSCIEKGDLEYLKTLQDDEPTVQNNELSQNQIVMGQNSESHCEQRSDLVEEGNSEYVPVDVKRLKSMFSEDKSHFQGNCGQSTSIFNASSRKCQYSTECNTEAFSHQQPNNTFRERGGQAAKDGVPHVDDRVHQAELAEVLDDADDISDLQTAIQNLQHVTKEAKSFHHSMEDTQKICIAESSEKPTDAKTAGSRLPQEDMNPQVESCIEISLGKIPLASDVSSGYELDWKHHNTERYPESNFPEKVKTAETCSKKSQECTEIEIQKQHIQIAASLNSSEKSPAPEEDEVVFQGKIQAALDSLEKSNINVTRGDFRAAMIYQNASKSHQRMSQNAETPNTKELCPVAEHKSSQVPPKQEVTRTMHEPSMGAVSQKRPTGPKPPLPPKPEHLKGKQGDDLPAVTRKPEATQSSTVRTKEPVPQDPHSSTTENKQRVFTSTNMLMDHQTNEPQVLQKIQERDQVQGSTVSFKDIGTDENIVNKQPEMSAMEKENLPQNALGKDINETDENHIDFHEACQKFEGKKASSVKTVPVKPKRHKSAHFDDKEPKDLPGGHSRGLTVSAQVDQKPAQIMTSPSSNTCGISAEKEDKLEKNTKHKVEMREKKRQTETEDERRQRLSVHMDEIMRGNITAAMEIFDNLRKQEQLQSILSRVEEIEQDTSNVDVKSLRRVFENVPDWVSSSDKKKQKRVRSENNEKPMQLPVEKTESKSSMEHVYGDLARASEEIMNLKEQTLAKLKDIEDAIKKALCSVSTLNSDSDIAGLSCLFTESLGNVQVPWTSGNVGKISNNSAQQSFITQKDTNARATQCASSETSSTQQSTPSSPAFISIQSAARKTDKIVPPETSTCLKCQPSPKTEERFRTTKMLTCNSAAQSEKTDTTKGRGKQSHSPQNINREVSVLEVQTDSESSSNVGTRTVTENYEKADEFGNKVYTSKTSTVRTPPLETLPTRSQTLTNPSTCQVSTYP
ncbi:LIM domain-containing protein isoform X2 [Kryptolebias marmoratus]|nr:LIM domain-containing protein isoform X2 [Kryptolebias marmoratus]